MTSIALDLFSGKGQPVISISIPVVSLSDYHHRLSNFVIKRTSRNAPVGSRNNIVCRQIFQINQSELFFLPCFRGKNVSLEKIISGRLFFLRGVYEWNFILIFIPEDNSNGVFSLTTPSKFTQEENYPEGVSSASPFWFSSRSASILVSDHGCIAKDSAGALFLQGITVSLLQTSSRQGRSVFVQRRDIFASPRYPLREENLSSLEPRSCKFIKISCFCRQEGFSYLTHFPVLTPEEAQEQLKNNKAKRRAKYGSQSTRYHFSHKKETVSATKNCHPLLIVLPPVMEIDIPFGSCNEGGLFFSYSDESSPALQLMFFPHLFGLNQIIAKKKQKCVKNWHVGNSNPLINGCDGVSATVFSFPWLNLVPSSAYEYNITGKMKVELVSAPRGGCWGVFCSPKSDKNSPVPGPSGLGCREPAVSGPQPTVFVSFLPEKQNEQPLQEKDRNSPVPGTSGLGRREPAVSEPQPRVIVSVPPEKQDEQTLQERDGNSPVPGTSSNFYSRLLQSINNGYIASLKSRPGKRPFFFSSRVQEAATVFLPPERQDQHTEQKGSSSPVPKLSKIGRKESAVSLSQEEATVSASPVRHSQQMQQDGNSERLASKISGSYGSSSPPCPRPRATLAVPSKRQDQHTEQKGSSSPVPKLSKIGRKESAVSLSQEEATVSASPVRHSQQMQQDGNSERLASKISGSYGSSSPPCPRPRATLAVPSKRQDQHTEQKGSSSPVPKLSKIGRKESAVSLSQEEATVSASPVRHSQQMQQDGNSERLASKISGSYGSSSPCPRPRATVAVPSKRQDQQTQQRSSKAVSGPSGVRHQVIRSTPILSQAASTAFVPFKQTQHTQQRRSSPVPEFSGVNQMIRPIPILSEAASTAFVPFEQTQHTQLRRSSPVPGSSEISQMIRPIPLCPQAESTAFVPFEQTQHTQQRRSSPVPGSSGISRMIRPIPFCPQAESNFFVPLEQTQHTQQRRSNPVPGFSGISQMICPIPIRPQAESTFFVPLEQTQHTQQRRSSPVPGPSEVSYYPYPQYGPWSFSEEFYTYRSLPPYPHPASIQDQWMPVFHSPSFVIRPPVAAFEPFRYDIFGQESFGYSERAEEASAAVPVGAVQQTPIWRPYEESSSASVPSQAQAENVDDLKRIDPT